MFVALVLANSRGGILSFLCQVMFLGALLVSGGKRAEAEQSLEALESSKWWCEWSW